MENVPSTNGDNGPDLSRTEGLADARDGKGRFVKGNPGGPGNPNARNVAAWRRALVDSVSADDVAQVMQRLIDAAKDGEPWAIRELLDRCFGKPHVQIELQADGMDMPGSGAGLDPALAEQAERICEAMMELEHRKLMEHGAHNTGEGGAPPTRSAISGS